MTMNWTDLRTWYLLSECPPWCRTITYEEESGSVTYWSVLPSDLKFADGKLIAAVDDAGDAEVPAVHQKVSAYVFCGNLFDDMPYLIQSFQYSKEDAPDTYLELLDGSINRTVQYADDDDEQDIGGADDDDEQDNVNHPKHYTTHPSGVECADIAEHHNFCVGNAIKYLWRAGLKQDSSMDPIDKQIEDLRKAIWYINREISRIERAAEQ